LAMIVAVTAVLAGITQGLVAELLRRRGMDPVPALIASLVSFLLASAHWLARPHLFSMLFAVVLLLMLESDERWALWLIGPMFALWANLHGGWAYGLIVLGAYIVGDAAEWKWGADAARWRPRTRRHAVALGLAALGTLLNPYGLRLHLAVL